MEMKRFHASSQYSTLFARSNSVVSKHVPSVAAMIEEAVRDGAPTTSAVVQACQDAVCTVLSNSTCPLPLLDFGFSNPSSPCNRRTRSLDTLLSWSFQTSSHDMLWQSKFSLVVVGLPTLASILLPTSSSQSAFAQGNSEHQSQTDASHTVPR